MVLKGEEKVKTKKNTGDRRQKTGERQRQEEWNGGRMQEEDRIQKSEFRRRETEVSMAVAGYSILDSGCCPNPEEEKTEW